MTVVTQQRQITILNDTIPWFGSYAGYGRVSEALSRAGASVTEVHPRPGILPRVLGKMYSILHGWPARNQAETCAELELLWNWRKRGVAHILFVEGHGPFIRQSAKRSFIATLHQPPVKWNAESRAWLPRLKGAIVLSRSDLEFFEKSVEPGRVRFIPHGIDTDFFTPPATPCSGCPRLLFAGFYLRNTAMLERVVRKLHSARPDLHFDLLVPSHVRSEAHLRRLMGHPAVKWHSDLGDLEMRALYQSCYLALLPMNSSTANNAVLEALSTGLPLVTTDVGGIRDYGGASVFPLVDNDDDDGMIALVEQYLDRPSWRDEIARKSRQFAETELAWPKVALAHLEAYSQFENL
jgi:glycosyltransferase involved in cell wall biosynthesis